MSSVRFRPMTGAETNLVEHLLRPDFPGKEELLEQLHHSRVRVVDENGSLEFEIQTPIRVADVERGVLTEGEFRDQDGGMGYVLLHIAEGKMKETRVL